MRSHARKWLQPVVALLLVAVADGWSRQSPERLSPARVVALEATTARPEKGHAYWISLRRVAPGLASDKDGVSQLVLLEDGVELSGRALHKDIRNHGGGLYSHWGEAIMFSTRDGSNPRTNGRHYEVRLPPMIPRWHRPAIFGLLVVAGGLLLHWLYGVAGGSLLKAGAWAFGGAVGLATVAVGSAFLSSPARELRVIHKKIQSSDVSAQPSKPTVATSRQPRTRHLARGDRFSFITDAPPQPVRPPRTITLRPSEAALRDDGYVELSRDDALRSVDPLDIQGFDLQSVVLELEVARGGSLSLQLSNLEELDDEEQAVELSFQVSTAQEAQTFRFRRPAMGGVGTVHHVALRKDRGPGPSPIVRIKSLRYSLRMDAFTEQPAGFSRVERRGDLRPTLWQSVPGHFVFQLTEGDGSLLKLAIGALAPLRQVPIEFAVSTVDDTGRRSVLYQGSAVPARGWHELTLNLPPDAQELLLAADQLPSDSALLWSGVRVIDPLRPPRRMVLILADTLRADALGSYGHEGDPTPALDTLAQQGVRFDRAFAQTYWTRPSMASIMTGYYVAATGVQTIDQRLPEAYETLAEQFAAGGFTTVGILTNSNAGPHAGLDQGFDQLRMLYSLKISQQQQSALLISEVVLPTLEKLGNDDVFFYLHLMETHGPYGPPEPPLDFQLPTNGQPVPFDRRLDRPWNPQPTAAHRKALYSYDVSSMDRALGDLFEYFDRHWSTVDGRPTPLAFVSDHGELLGERDQWGHPFSALHLENVQVPMIIRAPGRIVPNTEVFEPVEIRHLGATLLDIMGLDFAADDSVGTWRSLLPLLEATDPIPPFALAAAEESEIAAFSLFGRHYGYVARFTDNAPRFKVFADTELARQVTARWPRPMLERGFLNLRRSYLESQAGIRDRSWIGQTDSDQTIDPAALEHLKALGYIE